MKHFAKKIFATFVLASAAAMAGAAPAGYPNKVVTLIIPYPPGGTADVIARPLITSLMKKMGGTVILDYKPGASGTIATQYVARATPDGYTLLMVLAAHAVNPSLYNKLPYDSVKSFAPVSLVGSLPLVLYTNPSFPAATAADLIKYAKENSGQLSFGSAGNGNTSHLAAELFANMAGIKALQVPYKGGGPQIAAAMGGEINAAFGGADSLHLAKMGKLKALAVTTPQRLAVAPDIPTVSESGLKDFDVRGWYGIVAPAGTPADIVKKLNGYIASAQSDPEFKNAVESRGYVVTPSTPEEFGTHIKKEMERWSEVVKKAGVKLE